MGKFVDTINIFAALWFYCVIALVSILVFLFAILAISYVIGGGHAMNSTFAIIFFFGLLSGVIWMPVVACLAFTAPILMVAYAVIGVVRLKKRFRPSA